MDTFRPVRRLRGLPLFLAPVVLLAASKLIHHGQQLEGDFAWLELPEGWALRESHVDPGADQSGLPGAEALVWSPLSPQQTFATFKPLVQSVSGFTDQGCDDSDFDPEFEAIKNPALRVAPFKGYMFSEMGGRGNALFPANKYALIDAQVTFWVFPAQHGSYLLIDEIAGTGEPWGLGCSAVS